MLVCNSLTHKTTVGEHNLYHSHIGGGIYADTNCIVTVAVGHIDLCVKHLERFVGDSEHLVAAELDRALRTGDVVDHGSVKSLLATENAYRLGMLIGSTDKGVNASYERLAYKLLSEAVIMPAVLLNEIGCLTRLRIDKVSSGIEHSNVLKRGIGSNRILTCLNGRKTYLAIGSVCGISVNSSEYEGSSGEVLTNDRSDVISHIGDKSLKQGCVKLSGHLAVVTVTLALHPPEALDNGGIAVLDKKLDAFLYGSDEAVVKSAGLREAILLCRGGSPGSEIVACVGRISEG